MDRTLKCDQEAVEQYFFFFNFTQFVIWKFINFGPGTARSVIGLTEHTKMLHTVYSLSFSSPRTVLILTNTG